MKNCIKKSGLDLTLIVQELTRYENDLDAQISYLKKIYDTSNTVYEDLDSFQFDIEPELSKETKSQKKKSDVRVDLKAHQLIEKELTEKIKNDYSKKILKCIQDNSVFYTISDPDWKPGEKITEVRVVSSISNLDRALEENIDEVLDVKWELSDMIEQRESLIQLRLGKPVIKKSIEKIHWRKSEELLIQTFKNLNEHSLENIGENELLDVLSLHFEVHNRKIIPLEANLSFRKFIWSDSLTQLANFYRGLIDSKAIAVSKNNKHKELAKHIATLDGDIEPDKFESTYSKTKSEDIRNSLNPNYKFPQKNSYRPDNYIIEILKPLFSSIPINTDKPS